MPPFFMSRKPIFLYLSLSLILSFVMMSITPISSDASSSFRTYRLYGYGNGWYFKVYVPSSYNGNSLPLMIMLHGCTQNANDFARGTKMNQLAEQKNFIVLYPEMNNYYNATDCWNWFYDYNQHRGGNGEAEIINEMVKWTESHYHILRSKIFVAGMSAGGFMASIYAATYPDRVNGLAIHSGGMYNAANSAGEAVYTLNNGSSRNANDAGYLAYLEMRKSIVHRMPTIIFYGTHDKTVNPKNAWQAKQQWAQTNDYVDDGRNNDSVNASADRVRSGWTNGRHWYNYIYNDARGQSLIEIWKVDGLGHAWSGGSTRGSYTDPYGPKASRIIWNFFINH